ncbi:MAG TPA: Asp-tRNA(Asn)/Glu-tRNA(Gln) amidotransferase subunit GatA [Xanthomonadales bacterium]|nr:Asp-tRNA(Asn)/Glu-tRNA(Gln) amidotransferase subunit GatA [Xanthomonadales bacterium]
MSAIAGLARRLAAREVSARALAEDALSRASDAADLNAFVTLTPERAFADAAAADARIGRGEAGVLAGIPFAHKDLFCTAGIRTTCGSRMLERFVPPYDATVHERLADAGGVLVGKANLDEFAMGSSNENSHFGPVRNPWDPGRVPGGSSGGSAALVAAGVVAYATGSDTGGSVRQPAAFCGITGLKPSYGRVSRWGMVAYASSLDQAGVLARSAADCAHVLAAIAGADARDATCLERPVDDYVGALGQDVAGLRIGVVRELHGDGVDPRVVAETDAALRELEARGAKLVEVALPSLAHAIAAYYVIAPAEASANLARYDGVRYGHRCDAPRDLEDLYSRTRDEGFGAEAKRRILTGTHVLCSGYYDAYYRRAQQVRRLIANEFAAAFAQVDLLAGPTAPTVAFALGEKRADPLAMYAADVNTVAVNLAGLPAISLPAGFVDGLPVGLQLIAPAFAEARLIAAGDALQRVTGHHLRRPERFDA